MIEGGCLEVESAPLLHFVAATMCSWSMNVGKKDIMYTWMGNQLVFFFSFLLAAMFASFFFFFCSVTETTYGWSAGGLIYQLG